MCFPSLIEQSGGTKGIGRAIVKAFLKEGATVHFCSRTAKDVEAANEKLASEAFEGRAIGAVVDVTNKVRSIDILIQDLRLT